MVRQVLFVSALAMALALTPALGRTNAGQPAADVSVAVVTKATAVRDNRNRVGAPDEAPVKSAPAASDEARLSEYIEMHGRATDYTGRASFMPWSSLKQMVN